MKKITFLSAFLLLLAWGSYAQCIRTNWYPYGTIESNNLGLPQQINNAIWTVNDYSQLSNIIEGSDYIITCTLNTNSTNKYITVTDWNNNVISHGESPLSIENISSSQIRIHYADNATCGQTQQDHTVTIQAILDCSPPVGLTASGITTTSAILEWEPLGSETAWQVLVLENGLPAPTPSTMGTDVSGGEPTYTASLSPATTYRFFVRANCGEEFSPWNGPFAFVSACEAVAEFSENFDTYDYAANPTCWKQIKNGTGSSQSSYVRVTDYNFVSASRALQIYNENSGTAANLMIAAPLVNNLTAGTHRLKFYARSGSGVQNIQFGTLDNNTNEAVFTELDNVDVSNVYEEYAIDYTAYEGTDTYIAIRYNGTQYSSAFLDNIRWELAPSCADVSDIAIPGTSVTAAEAVVTWEPNGSETQWDVVYGASTVTDPDTLTPITPAPTGTPEALLNGLTDNTTYKVWVRSVCGEEVGAWVGPKTFKTNCIGVDALNENFDAYAYASMADCWAGVKNGTGVSQYATVQVADWNFYSPSRSLQLNNSDSQATANIVLASPVLTNIATGTHRVKFYAKSSGTAGSLQVGTIDNTTADGYFTSFQTIALTSTYTEYVVEFTDTETEDTRIAFRHNTAGSYNSIFIDNVIWEPIPLCADVTDIALVEANIETATITWNPGGDDTQWDVVFGESTVTDPDTLTPIAPAPAINPEATITGLSDNTNYKVWVRSVCGEQQGAWIGPLSFKTPCVPTDTVEENFDTTASGALTDCWSAVKNGTGVSEYSYVQVVDSNFNTPSRAVSIYNSDSQATANLMLVSPSVNTLSTGAYRVKFFAKSSGAAGSIQLGTVDNTTADAVFTEIETVAITSTYTEYAVNFTESEDHNFAFRFNTAGTYNYVYIDDVRWELAPLCADVTNVEVGEITTESAFVTWEAQGSETNWQVVYGSSSETDPDALTPSDLLTDVTFTINGLDDNANYKVWVRSSCGAAIGNGAWIGPIAFSTLCTPSGVPYLQDFESAATPALPNCSVLQNLSVANNWRTANVTSNGFSSKVLNYPYTYAGPANAWYYTRGISLTAGTEYTISYKYGNNSTNYKENLTVKYGTAANADDMTEEIGVHLDIQTATAQVNEVTFTVPDTGVYYFGFQAHSIAGQDQLYVDDIAVDVALGGKDFNAADFKFYPNPVKDVLNLSYDQNIKNVAVFNLLGQKVLENTINANTTQMDMSNLASGSYLVRVTSDNQTKTIKVIKQ